MIHEANVVRPNHDGVKVGGHQASSASVVVDPHRALLPLAAARRPRRREAAREPRVPRDRVPAGQPRRPLPDDAARVRGPAVVPEPDEGPGSRSISRPARSASGRSRRCSPRWRIATCARISPSWPSRGRTGASWRSSATRSSTRATSGRPPSRTRSSGLGNVTMIVDLNRQSLDRVIPGIRVRQIEGYFAAAGWQVIEAKYGRRLQALFAGPGGDALRRRIDDMTNEEYQVLIRRPGPEARARLIDPAPEADRDDLARRRRRGPGRRPAADAGRPRRPRLRGARAGARRGRRRPHPAVGRLRLHDQGLAPAVRR